MTSIQYIYIYKVGENLKKSSNRQVMFDFLKTKKKPNQFILDENFIVVEFLTEDEKVQKDKIVKKLLQEYADDFDTIIPYETSFQYSYRYTLCTGPKKGKIMLAEIMALLDVCNDDDFNEFYQTEVGKIKLHLRAGKLISDKDVLQLYNERDISLYDPNEVLEVIYEKRGFLQRMKMKAKKAIINLPKTIFGVFTKFLAALLRYIGISTGKSIFFKFIPIKTILQWVLNFLMIFFPALAPLIGISKMII